MADIITGTRFRRIAFGAVALAAIAYHVYYAVTGLPHPLEFRPTHLLFMAPIPFLFTRAKGRSQVAIDLVAGFLVAAAIAYLLVDADRIQTRYVWTDPVFPLDYAFGIILVLGLLEGCRRYYGWPLPILALLAIGYALFGDHIPGRYGIPPQEQSTVLDQIYLSTYGIFGTIMGVSANVLFLFILFGAAMGVSRIDRTLLDIARALVGSAVGGPAKMAVAASALMGSVSGSTTVNIMTTGSITIPMMKRRGYDPTFAGSVEATASTGGQILPPVMGATAFLMAAMLGIPYLAVMKAAVLPALLYFFTVYLVVHFYASRHNLASLEAEDLPTRLAFLKQSYKLLPLVALTVIILLEYSPRFAVLGSLIVLAALGIFSRDCRLTPTKILDASVRTLEGAASIAIVCGVAGIIIGVVSLTGVGVKLAASISSLGQDSLFISLLMTMVVTIVLGMGVPTPAAYIAASAVMAPVLIQLKLEMLVAHMFIFYYAALSSITPPVAVAAYVAASLSGGDPMRIAFISCRIGIVAFLAPFLFAYDPEPLFLRGSPLVIGLDVALYTCGFVALVMATEGWCRGRLSWPMRGVFLATAVIQLWPVADLAIRGVGWAAWGILYAYRFMVESEKRTPTAIALESPRE